MAAIEIDEARLLLAGLAMHAFVSSPQLYSHKDIVRDSVELADALLKKLEQSKGESE